MRRPIRRSPSSSSTFPSGTRLACPLERRERPRRGIHRRAEPQHFRCGALNTRRLQQPGHLPRGHEVTAARDETARCSSCGQTSRVGRGGLIPRTRGRGTERRRPAASWRREPVEAAEQALQARDSSAALRRAAADQNLQPEQWLGLHELRRDLLALGPLLDHFGRTPPPRAAITPAAERREPPGCSPALAGRPARSCLLQQTAAKAPAGRRRRRQQIDRDLRLLSVRASRRAITRAKLCSGSGSAGDARAARCSAERAEAQRARPRPPERLPRRLLARAR